MSKAPPVLVEGVPPGQFLFQCDVVLGKWTRCRRGPKPGSFIVTTEATRYVLRCKCCKAAWTLPIKPPHPGNVLRLLEHAAGCEKKANARNRDALNNFFGGNR